MKPQVNTWKIQVCCTTYVDISKQHVWQSETPSKRQYIINYPNSLPQNLSYELVPEDNHC